MWVFKQFCKCFPCACDNFFPGGRFGTHLESCNCCLRKAYCVLRHQVSKFRCCLYQALTHFGLQLKASAFSADSWRRNWSGEPFPWCCIASFWNISDFSDLVSVAMQVGHKHGPTLGSVVGLTTYVLCQRSSTFLCMLTFSCVRSSFVQMRCWHSTALGVNILSFYSST